MLRAKYYSASGNKHIKAVKLLLTLLFMVGIIICVSGCDSGVVGPYRVSSGTLHTSEKMSDKRRISELELCEDGSVIGNPKAESDFFSYRPTGRYSVEDSQLTLKIDGATLVGTIEGGTLIFESPKGGQAVFKKDYFAVIFNPTVLMILLLIYAAIVSIQSFLVYGLVARRRRDARENGDGVSLYFDLTVYGFYAFIPGLVFYMWWKEKQMDKAREAYNKRRNT